MKILVTNDDGYNFPGLQSLIKILKPFGELTIVAPKYYQSGMSMACSMGMKPIAVKKLEDKPGERWWYVDGTPSTCVKWGLDEIFIDDKPDVVVAGINHGSNAGAAALYSGTLGAAKEGALAGIPSFGVSLDCLRPDADFSVVEKIFPDIFKKLLDNYTDHFGTIYNVNFPNLPESEIKGIKVAKQGILHWEKEFALYNYGFFDKYGVSPADLGVTFYPEVEPGETVYMMVGDMVGDPRNPADADCDLLAQGYITITAQTIDGTDYSETERLCGII